jgi:phospholipase C
VGYYARRHLPTYDFLARNFCVCDAWHSSVPGETWPNRLFALAGREGPKALPGPLKPLPAVFTGQLRLLTEAPIYTVEAFTRRLADEQWRWYSYDPATLRAADVRYRKFGDLRRDNFAFFDRQKLSLLTQALDEPFVSPDGFLDDCASERLREVSWIDPTSSTCKCSIPTRTTTTRRPTCASARPSSSRSTRACATAPEWEETLLVVVYAEHGGFYDHIVPPPLPVDDGSGYETYGVRVPALVVGPRVANTLCDELFHHTTLIKTILQRFATNPEEAIMRMGPRVARGPRRRAGR